MNKYGIKVNQSKSETDLEKKLHTKTRDEPCD